ncbi:MAG: hypothetical protein ACXVIQ_13035 [Ilumatobacteraceae bacterium]
MRQRSQPGHKGQHTYTPARSSVALLDQDGHFPAPDPSTRVRLGQAPSRPATRPHGGELIVAAGLGAISISIASKFARFIDLPSLSEMSVAALGSALAVLGVLQRRRMLSQSAERAGLVAPREVEVDLPSLTGQLSALLAILRQQHGVVYRSRTWIEVALPEAGFGDHDPTLARDLLAAAALDAGGVRADVGKLSELHSRGDIVATSVALIEAVRRVLASCEQSTDRQAPRQSDPSCWPASAC